MASLDPRRVELLRAACVRDLREESMWTISPGYPDSLALCVVDSIYSTGGHYSSVVNVVSRYAGYRNDHGGDASTDGTRELLDTFAQLGGPDPWATAMQNRRPISMRRGAPLKAAAVRAAAEALDGVGLTTTVELRAAAGDDYPDIVSRALAEGKRAWLAVPGQHSGITWDYALMLAQISGVKADRMVVRYVADAIGVDSDHLDERYAASLVREVARVQGWDVVQTDHAMWRFTSGRQVFRDPQGETPS